MQPVTERLSPSDDALDRAGYRWALDVDWVYSNLDSKMTRTKAGSPSRWALWKAAKEDPQKFIMDVVVRTMPLLEKARAKMGDNDVAVESEQKSIRELEALLKRALIEAGVSG